jgi:hypothetical protein
MNRKQEVAALALGLVSMAVGSSRGYVRETYLAPLVIVATLVLLAVRDRNPERDHGWRILALGAALFVAVAVGLHLADALDGLAVVIERRPAG